MVASAPFPRSTDPGLGRGSIAVLYGLSGFASLGYQVVWFRLGADRFGATALTFVLVLVTFIVGLAVGALASAPMSRLVGRWTGLPGALARWGVLELAVVLAVAITPAMGLLGLPSPPSYVPRDGLLWPSLGSEATQVAVTVVCIALPTLLMGATYPLLCTLGGLTPGRPSRRPSGLYAANTLGACIGVVATELWLLPRLGHEWALLALMALNTGLGLVALGAGARAGRTAAEAPSRDAPRADDGGSARAPVVLLAVLAGLATGLVEGDVIKRVWLLQATSSAAMAFVSFWAILAIACAAATVRALPGIGLAHLKVAWVLGALAYAAAWHHAYPLRDWLQTLALGPADAWVGAQPLPPEQVQVELRHDPWLLLAYVGIFVFPVFYCLSITLPWLCDRAGGRQRRIGLLYGLDTLAFCAGAVLAGWAAPRVDLFYALKASMLALLVLTVAVLVLPARPLRRPWLPATAIGLALALAAAVVPRGFDAALLDPRDPNSAYPARALASNAVHTTWVVANPQGDRLYFDGHSMSGVAFPAQLYMRLMAHWPLLAQPSPRRALLIGYGVGNTAAALAAHPSLEAIDVVELNHQVIATAPEFDAVNGPVRDDPRVRIHIDDGRRFLRAPGPTYDLVTSEPPPPLHDGVYRLYSEEYYRDALARLRESGMLTQWLPAYQLSPAAVERIVSTFVAVFPHAVLLTGYGREYVLVGSRAPLDLARLVERAREPGPVASDLHRLGITDPAALLARIVVPDSELRARYLGGPRVSDLRNDLAYLPADPRHPPLLAYAPSAVRALLDDPTLGAAGERARAATAHLGLLRLVVPDFPVDSLIPLGVEAAPGVALAGADWRAIGSALNRYQAARAAGDDAAALTLVEAALAVTPEQPLVQLERAARLRDLGRASEAAAAVAAAASVAPAHPRVLLEGARVLAETGRLDAALEQATRAAAVAPDDPEPALVAGEVLVRGGRLAEAVGQFEEALRRAPGHPAATTALTRAIARLRAVAR